MFIGMIYSLSKITGRYLHERSIPCRSFAKDPLKLAQILLSKICAELVAFLKKTITSYEFIQRHRQKSTDFCRQRKLPAHTLIVLLLSLLRGSYQKELDRFFNMLSRSEVPERFVTKAALAKSRMKLKYQAFIELNHKFNQFFEDNFNAKTWLGFRLLAADGSTIRLPHTDNIKEHFGCWKPRQGRPSPMARLSQLFDPLNKITVDAIISPKHIGERELAANHFLRLMPNDLILMDRGYPAWWLFALILSMNAHFCARISKKWKIIRAFLESGEKQRLIHLPAPNSSVNTLCQMGLDRKPLKLRLIRIDNGDKTQILITSLIDARQYPYSIFSDLYHLRWPTEEDYKSMKSRIEIENFSGKSALSVYQDFHARVLSKNIASIFALPVNDMLATAETAPKRKHNYQVNFTHALTKTRDLVPLLFQRSIKKIKLIIDALFELLAETIEPIRPGRRYPRNHRISARKYYLCYKPIA